MGGLKHSPQHFRARRVRMTRAFAVRNPKPKTALNPKFIEEFFCCLSLWDFVWDDARFGCWKLLGLGGLIWDV